VGVDHLSLAGYRSPFGPAIYTTLIPTTDYSVVVPHIGTLAPAGISRLRFSLNIGARDTIGGLLLEIARKNRREQAKPV
jgi:hypothetical protein